MLSRFRSDGLSAAKSTYLALVRQGGESVVQLADRVGLSVSHGRRVAALRREGLVDDARPRRDLVVKVPPELAAEQLIRRHQKEMELLREAAHRLASEEHNRASNRRAEELIEIVSGRAAVGWAFDRVQRTARQQMRVLVAPPWAGSTEVNRIQLDREAAGVTYRVVYDSSALADQVLAASVVSHIRSGEQARLADALPTKLAVADRELALLPLDWTTPAHNAALLVHPSGLLDSLIALFETAWGRATPLSATERDGLSVAATVSADDRHLLSLLVAGLTDEAAGTRLGISRRTVARRVQQLMERTNSRSRLQLGWQARERGWL